MPQNVENPLNPVVAHYLLIVEQHGEFLRKACMIGALLLNTAHEFLMRQAFSIQRELAGMTDDTSHLKWVFEESSMHVLLSFKVITNNDTELAFSHLGSLGIKDISQEIICPLNGHWIVGDI